MPDTLRDPMPFPVVDRVGLACHRPGDRRGQRGEFRGARSCHRRSGPRLAQARLLRTRQPLWPVMATVRRGRPAPTALACGFSPSEVSWARANWAVNGRPLRGVAGMGPRCLKAGVPMAALMALYIYGQIATGPEQSSGSDCGRYRRAPWGVAKSCNVRSSVVRDRGIELRRGGAWGGGACLFSRIRPAG